MPQIPYSGRQGMGDIMMSRVTIYTPSVKWMDARTSSVCNFTTLQLPVVCYESPHMFFFLASGKL